LFANYVINQYKQVTFLLVADLMQIAIDKFFTSYYNTFDNIGSIKKRAAPRTLFFWIINWKQGKVWLPGKGNAVYPSGD